MIHRRLESNPVVRITPSQQLPRRQPCFYYSTVNASSTSTRPTMTSEIHPTFLREDLSIDRIIQIANLYSRQLQYQSAEPNNVELPRRHTLPPSEEKTAFTSSSLFYSPIASARYRPNSRRTPRRHTIPPAEDDLQFSSSWFCSPTASARCRPSYKVFLVAL